MGFPLTNLDPDLPHFCCWSFQTCRSLHVMMPCLLPHDSGDTFAGWAAATAAVASRLKGTLHTSAASDAEPLCESHRCITPDKDLCVDLTFALTVLEKQELLILNTLRVHIIPNIVQILLQKLQYSHHQAFPFHYSTSVRLEKDNPQPQPFPARDVFSQLARRNKILFWKLDWDLKSLWPFGI